MYKSRKNILIVLLMLFPWTWSADADGSCHCSHVCVIRLIIRSTISTAVRSSFSSSAQLRIIEYRVISCDCIPLPVKVDCYTFYNIFRISVLCVHVSALPIGSLCMRCRCRWTRTRRHPPIRFWPRSPGVMTVQEMWVVFRSTEGQLLRNFVKVSNEQELLLTWQYFVIFLFWVYS